MFELFQKQIDGNILEHSQNASHTYGPQVW